MILKEGSKALLEGDLGIETICVEEIKYKMLAQVRGLRLSCVDTNFTFLWGY